MHGVIFAEMKKYVETRIGGDTWNDLLIRSGLGERTYTASQPYPDEEAIALVSTASRITGMPVPAILEDFGEFIVPDLAKTYKVMIRPSWKTLDLIENTESIIHRVVRVAYRGATPPILQSNRISPDEVVVVYQSPRKMCALARGIVKGIAKLYDEHVTITETTCMLKGDPSCRIVVAKSAVPHRTLFSKFAPFKR
jgi:predicted hydrocarbon binding protein